MISFFINIFFFIIIYCYKINIELSDLALFVIGQIKKYTVFVE